MVVVATERARRHENKAIWAHMGSPTSSHLFICHLQSRKPTVAMCNDDDGAKSEFECNIKEQEVKNELKVCLLCAAGTLGLPQASTYRCLFIQRLIIAFQLHVFEKRNRKEKTGPSLCEFRVQVTFYARETLSRHEPLIYADSRAD